MLMKTQYESVCLTKKQRGLCVLQKLSERSVGWLYWEPLFIMTPGEVVSPSWEKNVI